MGDKHGSTTMEKLDGAWDSADSDFSDSPAGCGQQPCPMDSSNKKPDSDCAFLAKQANAKMPKEGYDAKRAGKASVGKPKDAKWPDGSTAPPAVVQEVEIDGQKIQVYSPKKESDKLPTTDQVAESLRTLPPDQRGTVKNVILHPDPEPSGASGKGGGGDIDLYPTSGTPTQRNVDYRTTHEAGHSVQEKYWGPGPDGLNDWTKAAKADGTSPSDYADSNYGDDFCEFLNVYNVTKGTPCEASAKKMYPNRWKKMEEYEKRK